jgi:hypothetical protein
MVNILEIFKNYSLEPVNHLNAKLAGMFPQWFSTIDVLVSIINIQDGHQRRKKFSMELYWKMKKDFFFLIYLYILHIFSRNST